MNQQRQPQDVSVAIHNLFSYALNSFSFFVVTSAALSTKKTTQLPPRQIYRKRKTITFDRSGHYRECEICRWTKSLLRRRRAEETQRVMNHVVPLFGHGSALITFGDLWHTVKALWTADGHVLALSNSSLCTTECFSWAQRACLSGRHSSSPSWPETKAALFGGGRPEWGELEFNYHIGKSFIANVWQLSSTVLNPIRGHN